SNCNDFLGKLKDCVLHRISKVDRADEVAAFHHPDHAFHQVVHITEGAGLGTVTVYCDVLVSQGLQDEVGDHPAVVLGHSGTIGVKDTNDADVHLVLAVIVHHQCFRYSFALVIAAADADRVDVAPVILGLGVYLGIAIDLRGGGLEYAGLDPLGHSQHVDGAHHAGFSGLDRVVLVMNR